MHILTIHLGCVEWHRFGEMRSCLQREYYVEYPSANNRFMNACKETLWFSCLLLVNKWCYKFNTFLTILPNILSPIIQYFALTYWTWRLSLISLQIAGLLALHPCPLFSTPSCNPESHSVPVHASPWIKKVTNIKIIRNVPAGLHSSKSN